MSHSFNGTTSKLVLASALISAVPLTLACFFKPAAVATAYFLLAADDGLATNRFLVTTNGSSQVVATTTATTGVNTSTTEAYVLNKWHSAAMVSSGVASRYAVLNGRFSAENTGSRTPTGISEFVLGNSGPGTFAYSGLLAEVAVWFAALTPAELQAFHAGVPATEIRPRSLRLYTPLTTQLGVKDLGPSSLILANTAATPISDHPSILRPRKSPLRRSKFVFAH